METIRQFLVFANSRSGQIGKATLEHLELSFWAILLAVAVAVPLGILLTKRERLAQPIIGITNVFQTIPSLALLGFLIPFLGIGKKTAIIALFLYSLLPILRNTYTGIKGVDKALIEAGYGMGMTKNQVLFMVELPLALSVIMAGIRTSTVINIGTATLAAMIGAGGLGRLIFTGLSMVNNNLILAGAIPCAILALLADYVLGLLENLVTPRGLKGNR
jgi:osmoprotectant transport system permease protein